MTGILSFEIGYGRHGHGGAGGGMINQLERATHMDLNGDGRVGGGYPPQHNQYGPPQYPPQYGYAPPPPPPNQYGPPGYPPQYGQAPPYNPYGAPGYGPQYNQYGAPPPHHGGGAGGGIINQLERATGMDLNGDGRIGGGHPQHYPRHY